MKTHASILVLALAAAPPLAMLACGTSDGTYAVITNGYPGAAGEVDAGDEVDAGNNAIAQTVVYRAWWLVTYFPTPVGAGEQSAPERVVTNQTGIASTQGNDTAFVVLAKNWAPASGTLPTELLPMRSHAPLSVARGDTLNIEVSDSIFDGNCAAGKPLSQADADRITQEIFPDEFAGMRYEATTCTLTAVSPDGGSDASGDAPLEGGGG